MLFPTYSLLSQRSPKELASKMRRVRLLLMLATVPMMAALAVFSDDIIRILYDQRYEAGGWYLRVLSIGFVPSLIIVTLGTGAARRRRFAALHGRAARPRHHLVVVALISGHFWGSTGLVIAVALRCRC